MSLRTEEKALLWAVATGIGAMAGGVPADQPDPGFEGGAIDPVVFVRLAELHGVVGLAADGALTVDRSGVLPDAVIDRLVSVRDAYVKRAVHLSTELLRLLDVFSRAGLSAITMKGPLFAQRFYGSLARRSFWDLDLLLRPADVLAAKSVLLAEGYRPEYLWTPRRELRELRRNCEYNFDHPASGTHVEVHWRFVEPTVGFGLSVPDVWGRAVNVMFMGRSVPALDREDELLALMLHNGAKHGWERLRMIADVAAIACRMSESEQRSLAYRAESCGIRGVVATGVVLATDLLGAQMPSLYDWAMAYRRAGGLSHYYATQLFQFDTVRRRDGLPNARAYLMMRERPVDRLRYVPRLLRAVFMRTDQEQGILPLPPTLRWVHYVLRPWRLAWKYLVRHFGGR